MMNRTLQGWFYRGWRLQDAITNAFYFVCATCLLGISAINLNAVIVSTGEPAFLDDGAWKAWLISLLAPLASLCLKAMPMCFSMPRSKQMYVQGLYGITALSIFAWIVLIALTFQGMGEEFSVDALLEESRDDYGQFYVFMQIFNEICMSSTLFLGWQMMMDEYNPQKTAPQARALDKQIAALLPDVAEAGNAQVQALSELEALKNQRATFINQMKERFTLTKAKHHFLTDYFGEQS